MDTTKSDAERGTDSQTLPDDSRTVADSGNAPKPPLALADIRDHELIRRIGQGSYGEVWLARNVMGTYRAVKIVYRAAFEHARPFEREFNGIQKFEPLSRSHDGFVDILQIGRTEEYFYYVMELADDVTAGQQTNPARYEPKTLRSEVQGATNDKKKALPFEQCIELGLSLTQALGHLHEHGLIHRDIKPSNIIFVNGQPKLADIGLVAEQSEAKSFVGTEGFIPPEGPGTPQADIYSLGKVLYEIATGKDRHEFPALPTLLGDTSSDTRLLELNTVFLKACQSDLKHRYQSCEQMRDDLFLLQSGKSVKRAQAVEKKLALLTKVSVFGIALTVLIAAGFLFARKQARQQAALRARAVEAEQTTRRNLIQELLAAGNARIDQGDWFAALPSYVEALERETDPAAVARHRMRIGSVLYAAPRLVQVWGHDGPVNAVAFSPDGRLAASASADRTARLWNAETGEPAGPALVHSNAVAEVVFSPDGRRLLTRSGSEAILWETATGRLVTRISHEGTVNAGTFSPDGRELLTASDDHRARLCDAATGAVKLMLPHPDRVTTALFSPDGTRLLTPAEDSRVRLWDHAAARTISEGVGSGNMRHVAFSPDGGVYAVMAGNSGNWIYDGRTGKQLRTFAEADVPDGSAIDFSPDGRRLLLGYNRQFASVWDVANGARLAGLNFEPRTAFANSFGARFSPDGLAILTWSEDAARVWSAGGQRIAPPLRHDGPVLAARFDSDGRRVITGGRDGLVKVWDLAAPATLEPKHFQAYGTTSGAWAPDGSKVVTGGGVAEVRVWDSKSGQVVTSSVPLDHEANRFGGVSQLKWTRDGRRLLTSGGDGAFRVWDGITLAPISPRMQIVTNLPVYADLSSDGELVAAGVGTNGVNIYNATTGERLPGAVMGPGEDLTRVTFSSSGQRLIVASESALQLWNPRTCAPVGSAWRQGSPIRWVDMAPDESRLVTAGMDGQVRVWNLFLPSTEPLTLKHRDAVWCARFSPDNRRLVTASDDGTACVWEVTTGKRLQTLSHGVPVGRASFNRDGRLIATASALGLRLWDTETGEPLTPWFNSADFRSGIWGVEFSPVDDRLLATSGAPARILNFSPDLRPIDQMRLQAALVSGAREGGMEKELAAAWQQMRTRGMRSTSLSSGQILEWHRAMGEFAGVSFGGQFHFTRWLKEHPDDSEARNSAAAGWLALGRTDEAFALQPTVLPVRPGAATAAQLDLTRFFNGTLANGAGLLPDLPAGLHRFDGVVFDVRGQVYLAGVPAMHRGFTAPNAIKGLPVGRHVHRLHMLQAASFETAEGTLIGRYTLQYADGERRELPIRYGEDLRNHWFGGVSDRLFEAEQAKVVWEGKDRFAQSYGATTRLYKRTYENPRPEVTLNSIDFETTMTSCSPFLIAITVE